MEIEERGRLLERELQDLPDRFSLPRDIVEIGAITRPTTIVAGQIRVRHESHLEFDSSRSFARRTTPASGVERKTRRRETVDFRLGQRREKLPDEIEDPEVGRRRGARRFPDRRLVDLD